MELNIYAVQKEVRALAESANLSLIFENGIEQPRTNGKTIYVPTPNPLWSKEKMVVWRLYVYQEIGHNVHEM